jgi:Family of unknown function (DUF5357)
VKKLIDQFQAQFKDTQQFSGTTALLLGIFSWLVYLLIREPAAKELVAGTGWFFIIVGTDWVLFKKTAPIPLLGLNITYGPWISGALLSIALYSNRFLIQDIPTALVLWPLLSGTIAAVPYVLKTGPKIKRFDDYILFERQYLVLLALISILLSCWIQFHFLLNNLIQQYPSLLADTSLYRSAFIVRVNPPPVSKGVEILETAEAMIRDELRRGELRGRSWADGQRLLLNVQTDTSPIRPRSQAPVIAGKVFSNTPAVEEAPLWLYNAQFFPSNIDNAPGARSPWYGTLVLQAIWRGPSSQPNGYTLEKSCRVPREPNPPPVRGLERPKELSFYLLQCDPIKSRERGITVQRPIAPSSSPWWRNLRPSPTAPSPTNAPDRAGRITEKIQPNVGGTI